MPALDHSFLSRKTGHIDLSFIWSSILMFIQQCFLLMVAELTATKKYFNTLYAHQLWLRYDIRSPSQLQLSLVSSVYILKQQVVVALADRTEVYSDPISGRYREKCRLTPVGRSAAAVGRSGRPGPTLPTRPKPIQPDHAHCPSTH